jgi:hypothetical protein
MLPLLLPYCCQAPTAAPRPFLWRVSCSSMAIRRADERTRTANLISLRVRFGLLYLSRKVVYLQGKVAAAYRRVTSDYAQVSVPVSVRQLLRGLEPAPFGATIRRNLYPRFAACCITGLGKPIYLLTVAHRFCMLRPQWCQQ